MICYLRNKLSGDKLIVSQKGRTYTAMNDAVSTASASPQGWEFQADPEWKARMMHDCMGDHQMIAALSRQDGRHGESFHDIPIVEIA